MQTPTGLYQKNNSLSKRTINTMESKQTKLSPSNHLLKKKRRNSKSNSPWYKNIRPLQHYFDKNREGGEPDDKHLQISVSCCSPSAAAPLEKAEKRVTFDLDSFRPFHQQNYYTISAGCNVTTGSIGNNLSTNYSNEHSSFSPTFHQNKHKYSSLKDVYPYNEMLFINEESDSENPTNTLTSSFQGQDLIEFVEPSEDWARGQAIVIQWKINAKQTENHTLRIDLCNRSWQDSPIMICNNVANSGSYTWRRVQWGLPIQSGYYLQFYLIDPEHSSNDTPKLAHTSSIFSIIR